MHPSETHIQNSVSSTSSMDEQHQYQYQYQYQYQDQDLDHQLDQDLDLVVDGDNNNNNILDQDTVSISKCHEPLYCTDNNPPDSYAVCDSKVADWLNNRSTFIERKGSVKFACTKTLDPCQTRSSRRVCLNQKPKLSIIGFRKKPVHQTDGKLKNNERAENVRLFRNRSEPGRDYCLLITEPVSPRVSCVGRVGSVRVQGRKAGVWRSFKAAFSNLVQANRVGKIAA